MHHKRNHCKKKPRRSYEEKFSLTPTPPSCLLQLRKAHAKQPWLSTGIGLKWENWWFGQGGKQQLKSGNRGCWLSREVGATGIQFKLAGKTWLALNSEKGLAPAFMSFLCVSVLLWKAWNCLTFFWVSEIGIPQVSWVTTLERGWHLTSLWSQYAQTNELRSLLDKNCS